MREWGYGFPDSWGMVSVPTWSRAILRVLRFFRSMYWRYVRVAQNVRGRGGTRR